MTQSTEQDDAAQQEHVGVGRKPTKNELGSNVMSWKTQIDQKGAYVRGASSFRNWITKDGEFTAASGRYHLYVANACPWAHRTRIVRKLKGLENAISIDFVSPILADKGWEFNNGPFRDSLHNFGTMREVYSLAHGAEWKDRVTVPVFFDKNKKTIVNNESSEIIQILNSEFNAFSATPEQAALDLCPADKRDAIDEINRWVYADLNNGVYKAGFARSQEAYDEAVRGVFDALDRLEVILGRTRWLTGGPNVTLADVRLFTTLIRFDPVYVGHFKCNKYTLSGGHYPNLWGFTRDFYNLPGIAETIDIEDARVHYYLSHESINPFKILPIGPQISYDPPAERRHMQ